MFFRCFLCVFTRSTTLGALEQWTCDAFFVCWQQKAKKTAKNEFRLKLGKLFRRIQQLKEKRWNFKRNLGVAWCARTWCATKKRCYVIFSDKLRNNIEQSRWKMCFWEDDKSSSRSNQLVVENCMQGVQFWLKIFRIDKVFSDNRWLPSQNGSNNKKAIKLVRKPPRRVHKTRIDWSFSRSIFPINLLRNIYELLLRKYNIKRRTTRESKNKIVFGHLHNKDDA